LYDEASYQGDDSAFFKKAKQRDGFIYEIYAPYLCYIGRHDIGFSFNSDADLIDQAANFILEIINSVEPVEDADVIDIKSRDKTERKALILARRHQGQFRRGLEKKWNGSCAVTKCCAREVLRASHIKPWKEATNAERLNPENGLLLSATFDAFVRCWAYYFKNGGGIIISAKLAASDREMLSLSDSLKLSQSPTPEQQKFLKIHRQNAGLG
jgi:hypothetical protein